MLPCIRSLVAAVYPQTYVVLSAQCTLEICEAATSNVTNGLATALALNNSEAPSYQVCRPRITIRLWIVEVRLQPRALSTVAIVLSRYLDVPWLLLGSQPLHKSRQGRAVSGR